MSRILWRVACLFMLVVVVPICFIKRDASSVAVRAPIKKIDDAEGRHHAELGLNVSLSPRQPTVVIQNLSYQGMIDVPLPHKPDPLDTQEQRDATSQGNRSKYMDLFRTGSIDSMPFNAWDVENKKWRCVAHIYQL